MAVIYFVMRRRNQSSASSPEAELGPAAPEPAEAAAPLPLQEEDRLALEAANVKSHWDDERRRVENDHFAKMKPIRSKLEKAKKLVETSGVGGSACAILRIMWHWPSWSQRSDWVMPIEIELLSGDDLAREGHSARSGKWLEWSWAQHVFRLELTVSSDYVGGDTNLGNLTLSVDGELALLLDVSHRLKSEYYDWGFFGVSAFKAGPWMTQLNELAGRLEIADRQWMRDHDKKFYGEKAAKIDLPETDA
jgi:hypothetical protein